MKLYINGTLQECDNIVSLKDLLVFRQTPEYVAVAVNMQHVPKAAYDNIVLQELDRVEILMPMQGG